MTLNPAVDHHQSQFDYFAATISNCCTDHLSGDNYCSRNWLRLQLQRRNLTAQLPLLG